MNTDDPKYKNSVARPVRPTKPQEPSDDAVSADYIAYGKALAAWHEDMDAYDQAIRAYRAGECAAMDRFKADALADVGLDGTIGELAWQLAWERGHSDGRYEVYLHLCELSSFAAAIMKEMIE